ncbi:hypothetical protein Tco_0247782 [Tanacetum coccineum]
MAPLPPREQRHLFLRYQGLEYTDEDIADFKEKVKRIYSREIHRVQFVDFQGMPVLMRDGLFTRMGMEHRDDAGVVVFTSRALGRLFDTRGPLVRELILELLSTLRFGEELLDFDAPSTIQFQLGGARRRLSWRQFILALGLHTEEEMKSLSFARYWSESERMILGKGDLHDYWRDISTDGDFLGPPPSYTLIRDLVLRLCHRMMAHSTTGRKSEAYIFGGQFVARLDEYFGLLTAKILGGLTVIAPELPIIDMAELVRLQISVQFDDTWAWVAIGQERQSLMLWLADPTPIHAPPPPPALARIIPQRMARLEEDVHKIRGVLTEQREVMATPVISISIPVIPVVYAEVPIAPADPLVALDVGIVSVISPIGVLDLVDYSSSSDSDPTKDSLLVAPELPLVSPFLCFDDSKADSESEPAEQRLERHESLAPSSEFPLAPVVAPLGIRRWATILRVGPFPAHRLAWRRISHRSSDRHSSPDFTSDSSSYSLPLDSSSDISSGSSLDSLSDSSSVHSSGCDASGSSLGSSSERFIPSEAYGEEHMEIGTTDTETVTDLGISEGVRAHTEDGIDMGVEVATSDIREDEEEFEAERQLEAGQLKASGERAGLADRVRSLGRENLRVRAMLCIERDRVDGLRCHIELSQEEFCQIRKDRDDTRRRLRRTMTNTRSKMTPAAIEEMINRRLTEALETYKANRNIRLGNGNDEGGNINGTEGVVGLIRWFEKMETVFHISNCPEKYQVKELMKLMAEVYCPRTKIQKMESEL